jgi:hypothetical protein
MYICVCVSLINDKKSVLQEMHIYFAWVVLTNAVFIELVVFLES